jgi:hypothetical protein
LSKRGSIRRGSDTGTISALKSAETALPITTGPGGPVPEVTNPADARARLEGGSLAGVGAFFRDVASLLELIGKKRAQPREKATNPPGYDPDWEFEFDTADMISAIEDRRLDLVGDYCRRLAKPLTLLGDMLEPDGRSEYRLEPVRRKRGKPRDQTRSMIEAGIHRELKFARGRLGGKLEAALSEVGKKRQLSRATLLRIWTKHERPGSRTKS